jgi:phosphotriesterase-related protein
MNRRQFLRSALVSSAALAVPAWARQGGAAESGRRVMTVNGFVDASELGVTLTHEHLFADVRPYAEQVANPLPIDLDEVVETVLPHLERIRALGCRTLVDCTATHLGRHPLLVKRLSDASGLHMLTVTGNYLAAGGVFIPPYVVSDTSEALARRWIGEWERGIGDTGIRPGLIKLGVEGSPLTDLEKKLLSAAAAAHRETGLTIAAHTGAWDNTERGRKGRTALEQIALLEAAGISPSAWIWVHAHNETERETHIEAARRGAWVSFDGFRPDQRDSYVDMIRRMRDADLLGRVLLSQDAGWYSPGEPRGGDFNPFHPIFTSLIPALRTSGFTTSEIDHLLVANPADAFSVRVRRAAG